MMIRKLLVSAATLVTVTGGAFAADLPNVKGPPVFAPPPPVFSWTGVYIGGQAGYQWGTSDPTLVTAGGAFVAGEPSYNNEGVVGGGHAGFNYQVSQFVFGIEGDIEGTSYSGSGLSATGAFRSSTRDDIEGSVRGRVGFAWDRVLFYGTGGVAFASIDNSFGLAGGPSLFSATSGRVGWTAGGGVEYAIDPNWSVRVEYRYTDYGDYNFATFPGFALREHETDNRVEAGFSYKFDMFTPPAPVVAKY
jgi:outer membrane immunogenic protein